MCTEYGMGRASRDEIAGLLDLHREIICALSRSGRDNSRHVITRRRVDTSVIAIWLGHESVRVNRSVSACRHGVKQRALDRIAPPTVRRGTLQPSDQLLAFLESL